MTETGEPSEVFLFSCMVAGGIMGISQGATAVQAINYGLLGAIGAISIGICIIESAVWLSSTTSKV